MNFSCFCFNFFLQNRACISVDLRVLNIQVLVARTASLMAHQLGHPFLLGTNFQASSLLPLLEGLFGA